MSVNERFTVFAIDDTKSPAGVYINTSLLPTAEEAEERGIAYGLQPDEVTFIAVVSSIGEQRYRVIKVLKGTSLSVGETFNANPC